MSIREKEEVLGKVENNNKIYNLPFNNEEIIILQGMCDLALKQGGIQNLQPVNLILNKIANLEK